MKPDAAQYHDFSTFNAMRRDARAGGEAQRNTIGEVARQFEAIFVQMMMKSMRDTVEEGGLLNDDSMRFYQDMMDQQLSMDLSAQGGIGLAGTIERQLSPDVVAQDAARSSSLKLALDKGR